MKRYFFILILVGCQAKVVPPPVSALPKPRPVSETRETQTPVLMEREMRVSAINVLFPKNETLRAQFADQRADILAKQQRKLDDYHARKENALGRNLPRVRIGENPNAPIEGR